MKTLHLMIVCALACVCIAAAAHAQEVVHAPGLFVRGTAGLNNGSSQLENQSTGTNQLSGIGIDLSAAAGWGIAENFAVHATALAWQIRNPAIGRNQGTMDGSSLSMAALGAGATLYVEPTNIYFTLSLMAGQLRLDDGEVKSDTNTGFVMEFGVGKEWFVANKFAIGPSGSILFHNIPDGGVDESWRGTQLAIRFSATFN